MVTVSGLQPVQIFEGTLFQPGQPPPGQPPHHGDGQKASSRAERAAAYRNGQNSDGARTPRSSGRKRANTAGPSLSGRRRSRSRDPNRGVTPDGQRRQGLREGTPNTVALIELMQVTTLQLCRCAQELLREGNSEGALQAYRRAIVVDPNNLLALTECGGLLAEHGDEENGKMLQSRAFSLMAWALADVMPDQQELSGPEAVDMLHRALRQQQREVAQMKIPMAGSTEEAMQSVWASWQEAVRTGAVEPTMSRSEREGSVTYQGRSYRLQDIDGDRSQDGERLDQRGPMMREDYQTAPASWVLDRRRSAGGRTSSSSGAGVAVDRWGRTPQPGDQSAENPRARDGVVGEEGSADASKAIEYLSEMTARRVRKVPLF